jgi:hypothetical protein
MDKRRPHLATMILSGQITRPGALAALSEPIAPPERLEQDLAFFLKKMRLTEQEFESLMRSPIKTYRDYPSHGWLFASVDSWAYRLVKRMVRPSSLDRPGEAIVQP